MFPIEQSAFLHALGHAIGNSLWQVAAMWLLYAAITSLFTLSASRKYQLATAASMAGFIWFVVTLVSTYVNAPVQAAWAPIYSFPETSENIDRSSFANQALYFYHSVLASLKSLSPYISCGYLLVFLLLGIRLVNGFRQVKFFASQGLGKVDVQWRLFVQRNAEMLQIKQRVRVFSSHYVQSPLTMGFWKPIILLPVASLNNLNTQQVEAILLHELAHIRRHDYLVNIFVQITEICLFFNPFMRLLLKQARQERENSCDDYVLQFQYNAKDYAKALLTIEKNNTATLLALSAKDNQSFQLLNRVKRMVAPQPHAFNYRQQLYLLLLLTILGFGFTVIIPKPKLVPLVAALNPVHFNSIGSKAKMTKAQLPVPPPVDPAGFDLIKTIQGIRSFAENMDLKEIEKEGKELGIKAEALGKAYGEEIEKKMQPVINDVSKWADEFSENTDAQDKMEDFAKDFESLPFKNKMEQLSHIDEYMAPALEKLNDALKSIPNINRHKLPVNKRLVPAFIPTPPLPEVHFTPNVLFNGGATDDRVRISRERMKVPNESEKVKQEIKRVEAKVRLHEQKIIQSAALALHQTKIAWAQYFNSAAGDNKCVATEQDAEDEGETPKASKAKTKAATAFTYTIQLPQLHRFKNFDNEFQVEWNSLFSKRKRANCTGGKRVVVSDEDEHIIISSTDDVDNMDIDVEDIKTINIQQQKRSGNGKENIVIIRISPSR